MQRQLTYTAKQEEIRQKLAEEYEIDADDVFFLNEEDPDEPWLNANALTTIARRSSIFQTISESYEDHIAPLNQVVHQAIVIDKEGRSFGCCGVATINEHPKIDAHTLAGGRAVRAALTAAGFNPLKQGSVATLDLALSKDTQSPRPDEAQSRINDMKRIHVIAERKIYKGRRLVTPLNGGGYDRSGYREFLKDNYGVISSADFDAAKRASLINALEQLPDYDDEFANVA